MAATDLSSTVRLVATAYEQTGDDEVAARLALAKYALEQIPQTTSPGQQNVFLEDAVVHLRRAMHHARDEGTLVPGRNALQILFTGVDRTTLRTALDDGAQGADA